MKFRLNILALLVFSLFSIKANAISVQVTNLGAGCNGIQSNLAPMLAINQVSGTAIQVVAMSPFPAPIPSGAVVSIFVQLLPSVDSANPAVINLSPWNWNSGYSSSTTPCRAYLDPTKALSYNLTPGGNLQNVQLNPATVIPLPAASPGTQVAYVVQAIVNLGTSPIFGNYPWNPSVGGQPLQLSGGHRVEITY